VTTIEGRAADLARQDVFVSYSPIQPLTIAPGARGYRAEARSQIVADLPAGSTLFALKNGASKTAQLAMSITLGLHGSGGDWHSVRLRRCSGAAATGGADMISRIVTTPNYAATTISDVRLVGSGIPDADPTHSGAAAAGLAAPGSVIASDERLVVVRRGGYALVQGWVIDVPADEGIVLQTINPLAHGDSLRVAISFYEV
jgi:hypothetical protein